MYLSICQKQINHLKFVCPILTTFFCTQLHVQSWTLADWRNPQLSHPIKKKKRLFVVNGKCILQDCKWVSNSPLHLCTSTGTCPLRWTSISSISVKNRFWRPSSSTASPHSHLAPDPDRKYGAYWLKAWDFPLNTYKHVKRLLVSVNI